MHVKKNVMMILAALFVAVSSLSFAASGIYLPYEMPDHAPLYGTYPCIGASEASVYYADPSSYYATSDGNVAYLGCTFYATSGGALPGGGPAKLTPYTAQFQTYTVNGRRKINYSVTNQNGSPATYFYNTKFLAHVFNLVASHTWIGSYL